MNIWLGLLLLVLVTVQLTTGVAVYRGAGKLINYHRLNALFIALTLLVHGYYGIGISFFGFTIGR